MAGYLGASPVPQTIQKKQSFTATASQTTFNTTGNTDGAFINVYLNGVRLINGTDYTATNGSDIVLTTGASASDVLDFETFNEFTLVDQTLETPTFRTSATLKNDTHEDTDGGRESTLIFKGEQSGGEISTLAEIQASHDGTADDEKGDLIFRTNDGSDGTSPTERARIDSDGSLRIANTTGTLFNSASATGIVAATSLQVATDSSTVAYLNRQTNDGQVLGVYRGGASVGNIGVLNTNNLVVASTSADHAGVQFGTHSITPMEANADADNTIDLGSAAARFNDLYLGGGAYIGGTVAANYLDDYEYGTWSGRLSSGYTGSITHFTSENTGYYVKVGKLVHFQIHLTNSASGGSSAQSVWLTGLPFTSTYYAPINHWCFSGFSNIGTGYVPILRTQQGVNAVVFQKFKDGTSANITYGNFGGSVNLMIAGTYYSN